MDTSFQLYSSRSVPSQAAFLSDLAAFGYTQVEGFGGVYEDPSAFRAAMDAAGLTMPSGHFGLDQLETDFAGVAATANTLGISQIVAPYLDASLRPTDGPGYAALAQRLAAVHQTAADHGFGFAWHNHDFEFVALADGSIPMAILLDAAPNMGWEADLAWIARGGANPLEWATRHADRLMAIHVKDIAPDGENLDQDGWCDVGAGTMGWDALTPTLRTLAPAALMIMEHDKPADASAFASRSIDAFKTF